MFKLAVIFAAKSIQCTKNGWTTKLTLGLMVPTEVVTMSFPLYLHIKPSEGCL
jgi:hypothetical protein